MFVENGCVLLINDDLLLHRSKPSYAPVIDSPKQVLFRQVLGCTQSRQLVFHRLLGPLLLQCHYPRYLGTDHQVFLNEQHECYSHRLNHSLRRRRIGNSTRSLGYTLQRRLLSHGSHHRLVFYRILDRLLAYRSLRPLLKRKYRRSKSRKPSKACRLHHRMQQGQ